MSEIFQNKYRIESARLKHWDYGWNASYFVTICTKNRVCFFGNVVNGEMVLNDIGKIVQSEWLKTFELRPDMNLSMGEFVVMPNHFHAIIGIGGNQYNTQHGSQPRDAMHCVSATDTNENSINNFEPQSKNLASIIRGFKNDGTNVPNVETQCIASLQPDSTSKNNFGPQSKNLASIIRGFKIGATKNARLINPDFAWQSRFHDHIIRDEKSFHKISEYIINNPSNWSDDQFR